MLTDYIKDGSKQPFVKSKIEAIAKKDKKDKKESKLQSQHLQEPDSARTNQSHTKGSKRTKQSTHLLNNDHGIDRRFTWNDPIAVDHIFAEVDSEGKREGLPRHNE